MAATGSLPVQLTCYSFVEINTDVALFFAFLLPLRKYCARINNRNPTHINNAAAINTILYDSVMSRNQPIKNKSSQSFKCNSRIQNNKQHWVIIKCQLRKICHQNYDFMLFCGIFLQHNKIMIIEIIEIKEEDISKQFNI